MRPLQVPSPFPSASPSTFRERVDSGASAAGGLAADWVLTSLRILLVVVAAVVVRALLHRAIGRVVRRAIDPPGVPASLRQRLDLPPAAAAERRKQRAETIGSVLRSVTSIVVVTVAGTTVLGELGVDLGPVLASAGIVGVALGFGAQNLVKDFLNGIFMILEDQYGVGDAVDLGEASGIVEAVGLRVTRVRSVDGTVWHVRNGEVLRVGNQSQGWARAVLDVSIAYGTDVGHAQAVIKRVADEVWHGDAVGGFVLDEPEVWGVEHLGSDGIDVRLVLRTAPLEQWKVAREVRLRLADAFAAEGIEIPFPQRSLWLRSGPDDAVPLTRSSSPAAAPPSAPPVGEADAMRADTGVLDLHGGGDTG